MILLCKHDWKVIQDYTSKSPIERLAARGLSNFKGADSNFYIAKHETILSCAKCGKLKRYVEEV